jgi:copper(I)-binding protein
MTRFFTAAVAATLLLSTSALADIVVKDPYARSSTPSSPTGAAFMGVMNTGDEDDTLIAATSDVSGRVELHTHTEDADGVMRMGEVEGGIPVPAGEMTMLKRGGFHVMFMGLNGPLVQDAEIDVTLTFEKAGEMQIKIPVDHKRKPKHGAMDHSKMKTNDDS